MRGQISGDEWLAELERLSSKNDRGRTSTEIGETIGRSKEFVRELLQKVNAMGRLAMGSRTIRRIDGRSATIPVYTILKAATVKSKGLRKR